jgi:hypothetical protein
MAALANVGATITWTGMETILLVIFPLQIRGFLEDFVILVEHPT